MGFMKTLPRAVSLLAVSFTVACSADYFGGSTIATNESVISDFPEEECHMPVFDGPGRDYFTTPPSMLDWTPTKSDGNYTTQGFRPRSDAAPAEADYTLAPDFIGANDGRLRQELRDVAAKKDPIVALCASATSFS